MQTPRATILSVDGISVCDSISRVALLRGIQRMEGGDALLPFGRLFYGSLSTYLVVHEIPQGEGGWRSHACVVSSWATQCVGGYPGSPSDSWRFLEIRVHDGKTQLWNRWAQGVDRSSAEVGP